MSHHIYTTDAIIMKLIPDGEDSLIAECLTHELGRIYLHVQGAKKIQNKHRMHVFLYNRITINTVMGKQLFRCTGIIDRKGSYRDLLSLDYKRILLLKKLFGLIQRLTPTGVPIPEIFATFEVFYEQVVRNQTSFSELEHLFLVVQLRILGILGYWNSDWTDDVINVQSKTFAYVTENISAVQKLVLKILHETQISEKTAFL